ncbi:MAG: UDP-N-acetylmuramate--L-alanine ligase [Clostridiales bacterium]|nr:UDP-N-acetylmuramate--L-alanine ligase [Clostridiales bacterium]
MNLTNLSQFSKVHLVGIGGCSMSGLAQLFLHKGYHVQGSDAKRTPFVDSLEKQGIQVFIGHDASNVGKSDLLVYSAAIPEDNCERVYAREQNILQLERKDALGAISQTYKNVIGISGCHGKTTITSMLALINEYSKLNSTIHIGGFVDFLGGGVKIGSHDTFITEACEFVESFLSLCPDIIVLNNIDDDHLNYFKDIEHIVSAFEKFVNLLPENGLLIANTDDFRVKKIFDAHKGNKISFGLNNADFYPAKIVYNEMGYTEFNLINNGVDLGRITLNIIGEYNMMNSIAASVCALQLGAKFENIALALHDFALARRRFEYYGTKQGAKVFHDYAHHPGEIKAVLGGAKKYPHNKMYVVFQCNSYSRAKTLFTKDVNCFNDADIVLVPDIFPGREKDDGTVHAKDMIEAINNSGVTAHYLAEFSDINDYLTKVLLPNDIVITLGSGDVFEKTRNLID